MEVATKIFHVLQPRQSGAGKARGGKNSSNSLSGIVSTLVPTFLTFVAFVSLFLILRTKFHRVYTPRATTSVVRRRNRTPYKKTGVLGWLTDFRGMPDELVLRHNSFDGYLWLRYLKMLILMCFVGCCITWPVLFPVNATGPGGQKQLDILNYSNSAGSKNRYYAHAAVSWVFLGFVMLLVFRERVYFIGLRQAYYLHPFNAARLSSRTVLFLSVPDDKLNETSLRELFGSSVRKIWFTPDCKKLEKMVEDRDKTANKLETGQLKLIQASLKKHSKNNADAEKGQTANGEDASRYIDKKDRPTHRLKPIIGKKVDTLEYGHTHIPEIVKEIEQTQEKTLGDGGKKTSAVFIEFSTQSAAQRALQTVALKPRTQMSPRYIGVRPDQVVWKNLGMSKAMRSTRNMLATTFVVLLTIFWTIPIAIVGAISNINYLTSTVHFLSFIDKIPKVILGVVTGLLPVVLLAVVIALVPVIMRLLAKMFEPTLPRVEIKTQGWYFIFQVIQVFLVMTFASGASSVAGQIVSKPSSALTLLAENLPKASNFYINYFILQGLSIAGSTLLSIGSLAVIGILGKYLDKTPRKQYNRWSNLGGLGWGSVYPKYTNLGVIAISYSCIAPLILGFAAVGISLLYLAFRYNEFFVLGNQVDTKGVCYSRALQQLLTGVYLSAICLAGLFGISKSWGPLGIELGFILFAAIFHIFMNRLLSPLEETLPLDLQADGDQDLSKLTTMEEGDGVGQGTDGVHAYGRQQGGKDDVQSYGRQQGGQEGVYSYGRQQGGDNKAQRSGTQGGTDDVQSYGRQQGGQDGVYSYDRQQGGDNEAQTYGTQGGNDNYQSYGRQQGGQEHVYSHERQQGGDNEAQTYGTQGRNFERGIPMTNMSTNNRQQQYQQGGGNYPMADERAADYQLRDQSASAYAQVTDQRTAGQEQRFHGEDNNPVTGPREFGSDERYHNVANRGTMDDPRSTGQQQHLELTDPREAGQHQRYSEQRDHSQYESDHNSEANMKPKDEAPSRGSTKKLTFVEKMQRKIMPQLVSSEHAPGSTPPKANPITRFFKPGVYASGSALRPLIENSAKPTDADFPKYGEDAIHGAYIHPVLTTPTPVIWLARDTLGISKLFVNENEKAGLESSDNGAVFNEKNKAVWTPPAPLDDKSELDEAGAEQRWQEKVPIWRREADY